MTGGRFPELGQRVQCTACPNADGSLGAGTVVRVVRQEFAADLVEVAWDGAPLRWTDHDLYSTDILQRERVPA